MHNVYFVLSGEGKKHSRGKTLLRVLHDEAEEHREVHNGSLEGFWDYRTVLISGLSAFNPDQNEAESHANFVKKGIRQLEMGEEFIPEEHILLENKALDTLGNMVFGREIVEDIIAEHGSIDLLLITERFHMDRSKSLFQRVFSDLLDSHEINFRFEGAPTRGTPLFLYRWKLANAYKNIRTIDTSHTKILSALGKRLMSIGNKYAVDKIIHTALLVDATRYGLDSFQDYKDFLFSLPIYDELYTAKHEVDTSKSVYAAMIRAVRS